MILIVGCGFLGSYLAKHISAVSEEKVLAVVRNPEKVLQLNNTEYVCCDIANLQQVKTLAEKTKCEKLTVYYFAACHNIDFVYLNPEKAREINITALHNFLNAFDNIEKLIFASTDCVYGENGKVALLDEASELNPVSEYGRQKAEAEKIVSAKGFTSVRLPFMLGPSLFEGQPHFYDRIKTSLQSGQSVEMIDGLYRNVMSYSQASELLFALSKYSGVLPGVINVCSDIGMSKYEMGCRLAEHFGFSDKLIVKISEKEGEKFFTDKRASFSVMDNSLLKSLLELDEIKWEV